jgi:hypothetical protein
MKEGFLVVVIGWAVRVLFLFNPAEWVKICGARAYSYFSEISTSEDKRAVNNLFIDLFIAGKWVFVGLMIYLEISSDSARFAVWYLTWFNLFGYFYYHAWGSSHAALASLERDRRRFVTFIQAVLFSVLSFTYLYQFQYNEHFRWPDGVTFLGSLNLSVANSFTLAHEGFDALDAVGRALVLLQVANMFTFFTILIGNSVPNVGRGQS